MKKGNKLLVAAISGILATAFFTAPQAIAATTDTNHTNSFGNQVVKGSGKIVTKSFSVNKFDAISMGGKLDVTINPGKQNEVVLTTDENILPYREVMVENNTLNVRIKSGFSITPSQTEKVVVTTASTLHTINLTGYTNYQAKDLNTDHLALTVGGNTNGNLQGDIKKLNVNLGGKSELHIDLKNAETISLNIGGQGAVHLNGTVKKLTITSGGEVMVSAKDLKADEISITGAGKSDITVRAVKSLSVTTLGKTTVKYYGNPKVTKSALGSTVIEKQGE